MNFKSLRHRLIAGIVLVLGLLIAPGCGESGTGRGATGGQTAADAEQAGEHAHQEGPHGGELLDTGGHDVHLEYILHCEEGRAVLHVLGPDVKTPLDADEPPALNIMTDAGPKRIATRSTGGAATYEAVDPGLASEDLAGQVVLTVNGKTYYVPLPGHLHEDGAGHAHDHGGNTISRTAWTDDCEWFVELDAPVKDHDLDFAAHVTLLNGFKPATSGLFRVEGRSGTRTVAAQAGAPTRPGIFTPAIRFPEAGEWTLKLTFENESLSESIEWPVTVHETEIQSAPENEKEGAISFLKEDQWKVPFGTAWIEKRENADGVERLLLSPGSIVDGPGGKAVFVQIDGESFARRPVEILTGDKNADGLVEILSGLEGGERIVTRGTENLQKK